MCKDDPLAGLSPKEAANERRRAKALLRSTRWTRNQDEWERAYAAGTVTEQAWLKHVEETAEEVDRLNAIAFGK